MSGNKKSSQNVGGSDRSSVTRGYQNSGYTEWSGHTDENSSGASTKVTSPRRPLVESTPMNIPARANTAGSHVSSLPQSTSFSLPKSSPAFSPILTKFEDHHMVEYNSSTTIIAGVKIREVEHQDSTSAALDSVVLDDHSAEEEDPQVEEEGASQPSVMVTSRIADMKVTTAASGPSGIDNIKAKRICGAVSEYYKKQFVLHWMDKTKGRSQGSNTMSVIAALLMEKGGDFNVVVLTAGTKIKTECTFVQGNAEESTWGLCDGHAEAVCYRLASIYFLTEIYKTHKRKESIFEFTEGKGYKLKNGIEFHLFTSHPPCGFMAKKERYYLSWKRPFKTIPHNPQCSSKILINSYLGIQGPLSHLLIKPIYISSLVILRYETVPTLHDDYIEKSLQVFLENLSAVPGLSTSSYYFVKPEVFVVDTHPNDLFPTCFTPYIHEKRNKPPCDGELPHQESTIKQKTKPHTCQIGGTFPDALGNAGIETLVFSINNGIGSKADRDKMTILKGKLFQPSPNLKQQRLQSLQEARKRLSKAIDVSKALKMQDEQIVEQIKTDYDKRCDVIDDTISTLSSLKIKKSDIDELTAQVNESKTSIGKIKESGLQSLQTALSSNLENEKMHQDLQKLKEKEGSDALDQNVYLDVMGCDWARYMETMQNDF